MRPGAGVGAAILLLLNACRPFGAEVVLPTAPPVATSYVAPLSTVPPTVQPTGAATPQPEDLTAPPSIITVEPASELTASPASTTRTPIP